MATTMDIKGSILLIAMLFCTTFSYSQQQRATDSIPSMMKGNFTDDYDIRYNINDSIWTQLPNVKYQILVWDTAAQYLLARNDNHNPSEKGLYTRIDYMAFTGMAPYSWGFCLTVYNAASVEEARDKAKADRHNPKKGCNGFPFSRMKPATD